jgi:hypothetical protein
MEYTNKQVEEINYHLERISARILKDEELIKRYLPDYGKEPETEPESESEEDSSDEEWDEALSGKLIREYSLTMASGGDHWWNYIITSEDDLYIENRHGKTFQYNKMLIYNTERELYRMVSKDYETDNEDIIFIEFDIFTE